MAPAFDSSGIALLSAEEQADVVGTAAGGSSAGGPLRPDREQGAVRKKRVKFSVRVKVVGPPRVVLEGR